MLVRRSDRPISRRDGEEMGRSPSFRWMRAAVYMSGAGAAMFCAGLANVLAHGPHVLSIVFFALIPFSALAAFILGAVASVKSKAENQRLVAQALAKGRTEHDTYSRRDD